MLNARMALRQLAPLGQVRLSEAVESFQPDGDTAPDPACAT